MCGGEWEKRFLPSCGARQGRNFGKNRFYPQCLTFEIVALFMVFAHFGWDFGPLWAHSEILKKKNFCPFCGFFRRMFTHPNEKNYSQRGNFPATITTAPRRELLFSPSGVRRPLSPLYSIPVSSLVGNKEIGFCHFEEHVGGQMKSPKSATRNAPKPVKMPFENFKSLWRARYCELKKSVCAIL